MQQEKNVMEDVAERCSHAEGEDDWDTNLGVNEQEDSRTNDVCSSGAPKAPPPENAPKVGTRETERALNRLFGHLKVLTSLAHNGTLNGEQILELEERLSVARERMVASEKSSIEGVTEFAQEGKKIRKRKVATDHGVNSDQTLKRKKIPGSGVDNQEFSKQKGRGRPAAKNKEALPRKGNAGVNWEEMANMHRNM